MEIEPMTIDQPFTPYRAGHAVNAGWSRSELERHSERSWRNCGGEFSCLAARIAAPLLGFLV